MTKFEKIVKFTYSPTSFACFHPLIIMWYFYKKLNKIYNLLIFIHLYHVFFLSEHLICDVMLQSLSLVQVELCRIHSLQQFVCFSFKNRFNYIDLYIFKGYYIQGIKYPFHDLLTTFICIYRYKIFINYIYTCNL